MDRILKMARLEETTIYDFYALTLLPKDMYERDEAYANKLKYSVLNLLKRQLREEWIIFADEIESTSFIGDWKELFINSIGTDNKYELIEDETYKIYNEYVKNFDKYKDINPPRYFGKKWAILWINYIKTLNTEDWDQFVQQFDYFIDLSHNTEEIYNAFEFEVKKAIDNKRYFRGYELLKYCSEEVKKFVSKILNIKEQLFDFGNGLVPAYRHINPNPKLEGGWVANTAYVDDSCYIGKNAKVFNFAQVKAKSSVYNFSIVCNNAKVLNGSEIRDKSIVKDNAIIVGSRIIRNSIIYGKAKITNSSKIINSKINYNVNNKIVTDNEVLEGNYKLL